MLADFEDKGILIDFIMLCETFVFDLNQDMFPLPDYKIVCNNRKHGQRGGVAIYTRDIFQYKLRDDLTMNYNNEFETIFIEIDDNMHKMLIGEIYRVPGTSAQLSIQRYQSILHIISAFNGDVMIGSDQNFNYANIDKYSLVNQKKIRGINILLLTEISIID